MKLSLDNRTDDLSNQLYKKNVILTVNSNAYQSLAVNDGQLDEKRHRHQPTINQSLHQHHQINQLKMPHNLDPIYIESYKIFLPDGAYSYASELTVLIDGEDALGEYLCVNFGATIHFKSAFIKLKGKMVYYNQ